ncbi:MAG: hypothetical protein PVI98_06135 [Burkholderiales bacterium]
MDTHTSIAVRKYLILVAESCAARVAMTNPPKRTARHTVAMVLGACLSIGMGGCTQFGPKALSQGRPAYNEVLAETTAAQSLAYVIRIRYGETSSLLSVASINATVRFRSNAAAEIGVGSETDYAGNLVPLSGGVAYEEAPTITYVPAQGPEHLRTLLSPVPSNLVIPLLNNAPGMGGALTLLVERVNGVSNPTLIPNPDLDPDRRFERVAQYFHTLNNAGVVKFVQASNQEGQFYLWLRDYAPDHVETVATLLSLVEVDGVVLDGSDILLPIEHAIHGPGDQSITLHAYSVFELAKMLAFAVDVPPEDMALGLVTQAESISLAGEALAIRRAKDRPENATVATKYRGWWFYVDGADERTKLAFRLFNALMTARIADATHGTAVAPALTVPVGGQAR